MIKWSSIWLSFCRNDQWNTIYIMNSLDYENLRWTWKLSKNYGSSPILRSNFKSELIHKIHSLNLRLNSILNLRVRPYIFPIILILENYTLLIFQTHNNFVLVSITWRSSVKMGTNNWLLSIKIGRWKWNKIDSKT